jgi:lipoprotein NlpI
VNRLFAVALGAAALWTGAAAAQNADWQICSSPGSDVDAAIAACSRLVASAAVRDADRAAAQFNRATFHLRKGETDRAIADYNALLSSLPGDVVVLNSRGEAHSRKADFDSALADFDEAVRQNPRYPLAFRNRARIHFYRGNFDSAAEDFRFAEQIDRSNAYSLLWRYVAEARAGTIDQAGLVRGLAPLREGWPKPIVLHYLGRMTEAAMLAAAAADPARRPEQECEAYFFLGQKHVLAGETAAAAAALKKAAALCPDHMVEHHATRVELKRLGAAP